MQANVEQIKQDIQNFKRQLKIERNLSEHTLRAYECDLHCMLRWIETYHIQVLNDKVTMSYFNYLQDEEHLSARSIRRKYVALRQFFEYMGEAYDVHEKILPVLIEKVPDPKDTPEDSGAVGDPTAFKRRIEELSGSRDRIPNLARTA